MPYIGNASWHRCRRHLALGLHSRDSDWLRTQAKTKKRLRQSSKINQWQNLKKRQMKLKFVLVYFNVWNVFEVIYAPTSMCFSLFVSLSPPSFFFPLKKKKNIWELIGFPGFAARHCDWSLKRWICWLAGHEFDNRRGKGRKISPCTQSKRVSHWQIWRPRAKSPLFPDLVPDFQVR